MAATRLCLLTLPRFISTPSPLLKQSPLPLASLLSTPPVPRLSPLGRHFANTAAVASAERRFSVKHEWVTLTDGVGTVGVSEYAQEALGDIVYAQMPDVDADLDADDECGALESVKAASEIYTPVSGVVVAVNESLVENPGLINSSPYDEGWLFKIRLSNPQEMEDLMDEAGYDEFLKSKDD